MEYYTKLFKYNNTLGLPCVTKENLTCIGVEEASVGWNDDPMKDNPIDFCPTGIILSNNYDCIAPIRMEKLHDAY